MNDYHRHLAEHRRLAILRILERAPAYSANDSVLLDMVVAMGISSTRDQVRTDMDWLAEQGLVRIEAYDTLKVGTVTGRGLDAARGLATVEGVKRPAPR